MLSRQLTTKGVTRLRGCASWSAPLLFAYGKNRFSHDGVHLIGTLGRRKIIHDIKWATSCKNPFLPYTNNKCADQPAHPHSLISYFVVRCLDSIIYIGSIPDISWLYLASLAQQTGLSLTRSKTPKTGFLETRLIWICPRTDWILQNYSRP